jgi:hypothetical protein
MKKIWVVINKINGDVFTFEKKENVISSINVTYSEIPKEEINVYISDKVIQVKRNEILELFGTEVSIESSWTHF